VSDERKLDSVERLTEKYETRISGLFNGDLSNGKSIGVIVRAALTEMWDLSRREALREAAEICRILESQNEDYRAKRPYLPDREKLEMVEREVAYSVVRGELERLGRLAVEEGTK
jgi:hypothetical protein